MKADELFAILASVAPIKGVTVGLENDRTTWTVDWGTSTAPQIAAGAALIAAASESALATDLPDMKFDCQLVVDSASFLSLVCKNGNMIFIDGINYPIIRSGATVQNTGLVAATMYFVYAYWSGFAVALEISTAGFVGHPTYAYFVKNALDSSGRYSRTLVGMVYTAAGTPGTFVDSETQRFCASFYNRINKPLFRQMGANRGGVWTFPVEMSTSDRAEFISWGDEPYLFWFGATGECAVVGHRVINAVGVDGTATRLGTAMAHTPVASISQRVGGSQAYTPTFGGPHYITGLGGSNAAQQIDYYALYSMIGAMLRQ
jgi:hypothetical protein